MGAPSRYLLDRWVQAAVAVNHPARIPLGTLLVNVLGSAILGCAVARLDGTWLLVVGSGFCGAFTTFSTFAALTDESFREGWRWTALANIVASVTLCLLAFHLGFTLAGR